VQAILGKKLVGCYLFGSLVTRDFDHRCSDIDLLAALSSDLDENELASLQKMHLDFARKHEEWDDRIEVAYFSVAGLKT
jgi:predicted nucleotidyltransferase